MSSESQVKNQEEKNSDFSDKVLMRPPSKPLEQKDDQPGKRGKNGIKGLVLLFFAL